jgi:hypothetical protein
MLSSPSIDFSLPDLSLIIKARHDGANYVYSLLTGFVDAPDNFPFFICNFFPL